MNSTPWLSFDIDLQSALRQGSGDLQALAACLEPYLPAPDAATLASLVARWRPLLLQPQPITLWGRPPLAPENGIEISTPAALRDAVVGLTQLRRAWRHGVLTEGHFDPGTDLSVTLRTLRLTNFETPWPQATARQQLRAWLRQLAEAGRLEEPLHLWLGPPWVLDGLSPYPRDLKGPLEDWSRSGLTGGDLTDQAHRDETRTCALAHDFLVRHPEVVNERNEAEAAVGLFRGGDPGTPWGWVNLAHVDLARADSRLAGRQAPRRGALLQLPPAAQNAWPELLERLGSRIASVMVVEEASVLGEAPFGWIHAAVDAFCGHVRPLPTPALSPEATHAWIGGTPTRGAALDIYSPWAIRREDLAAACRSNKTVALTRNLAPFVQGLTDARWRGQLVPDCPVTVVTVAPGARMGRRPHRDSLAQHLGLAVAYLRTLFTTPDTRRTAPEPARRHKVRVRA